MCNWLVCQLNAQKLCLEIIEQLIKEGYRYQISHKDLVKTIMQNRNIIDDRAINRWIKALITFEYLTPEQTTTYIIYKINPTKIPHLINNIKEKPQTKLQ